MIFRSPDRPQGTAREAQARAIGGSNCTAETRYAAATRMQHLQEIPDRTVNNVVNTEIWMPPIPPTPLIKWNTSLSHASSDQLWLNWRAASGLGCSFGTSFCTLRTNHHWLLAHVNLTRTTGLTPRIQGALHLDVQIHSAESKTCEWLHYA